MGDIINGPRPIPILRYTGVFDYDGIYNLIVTWFSDNKYRFWEAKHEFKPTPDGKELKIHWQADKKVTGYLKYMIKIELVMFDMKKVEIMENNIKKQRYKGRFELKIKGEAELDYEGRWETSEFNEKLRKFMHKYLLKYYIMFKVWDPFYYKVHGLLTKIKIFLNMETTESAY